MAFNNTWLDLSHLLLQLIFAERQMTAVHITPPHNSCILRRQEDSFRKEKHSRKLGDKTRTPACLSVQAAGCYKDRASTKAGLRGFKTPGRRGQSMHGRSGDSGKGEE